MFRRQSLRLVVTAHHHLQIASRVASVSAHSSAALCARAAELHRQCSASIGQCAGAQIWPRLASASCWISRRLRLGPAPGMRGSCGTRPLRQSYITPHCPQCPPVATLKLHLVPVTASRPSGEGNGPLCKIAFAGYGRTAVGASRLLARPTRRRLAPLWLLWRCGIGQALRAVFWSVACGQLSCVCPAHPVASPLRGFGPALVCPSAPKGLPQPSAGGHAA